MTSDSLLCVIDGVRGVVVDELGQPLEEPRHLVVVVILNVTIDYDLIIYIL